MLELFRPAGRHFAVIGLLAAVLGLACQRASRSSAPPSESSGAGATAESHNEASEAPANGAESTDATAKADPSLERLLGSLPAPPESAPALPAHTEPPASLPDLTELSAASTGSEWASGVMRALRSARLDPTLEGELRFRLVVCKDGSSRIEEAPDSTMPPADRAVALRGFAALTLPSLPADVAAELPGECATVRYTFVWSAGHVR